MTNEEIIAAKDAALQQARETIVEQNKLLEQLSTPPFSTSTVLNIVDDGKHLLMAGNMIVPMPENKEMSKKIKPGSLISVNQMTGGIVNVLDFDIAGAEATVKRVFASDMMEVEGGGSALVVIHQGRVKGTVKPGDRVQLDSSGAVALAIMPKDTTTFTADTDTGVDWSDIGGQDEAKASLREAVEGPLTHAKLFQAYNRRPIKGMLLSGPPGCGKTLLAKATASAIRKLLGAKESAGGFIYVKGPEVLSMWVGNSEAQIRDLFKRAKEHKAEHGFPAVIFIDEADAILGKRGTREGSVLASTIVPQFLSEMDGMGDSGAFVLLATNRPDVLDPAVVRDGRIDRKVVVSRPNKDDSMNILKIYFKKTKVCDGVTELATTAVEELFDDKNVLYRVSFKNGGGVKLFTMAHLVSGAMLAGVVDESASMAIKRDMKVGGKNATASGIKTDDVKLAVRRLINANRHLNHDDDLVSFAERHGDSIGAVQKVAA